LVEWVSGQWRGNAIKALDIALINSDRDIQRLETEAADAEVRGLQQKADELRRAAEAEKARALKIKEAAVADEATKMQLDLEWVADHYYVSPYPSGVGSWYAGAWYESARSRQWYSGSWYGSSRYQSSWYRHE
jgi:hypothetical protein